MVEAVSKWECLSHELAKAQGAKNGIHVYKSKTLTYALLKPCVFLWNIHPWFQKNWNQEHSLCRDFSSTFTYLWGQSWLLPPCTVLNVSSSYDILMVLPPHVMDKKLRLSVGGNLLRALTAAEWQSQDPNPGLEHFCSLRHIQHQVYSTDLHSVWSVDGILCKGIKCLS